jgi:RNA polymerase sigma factor (sigma-70 family)
MKMGDWPLSKSKSIQKLKHWKTYKFLQHYKDYMMLNPESIYNQYSKKIYNLAYRMTGNKDDANDITQETFIQVFKSIDKFKGESHVYTWLFQIAKNNCLRFLEKKKKNSFLSLQDIVNKASSSVSDEISETEKTSYIAQVKDGCLSGLLRCLSFHQRLVFILNVLFDLPIEQVASIINKSQNATRILVNRSKQNIKEFLCSNCSLFDSKNHCHCENLINFSLKQGWISFNSETNHSIRIETEIKELKKVISLYKTLPEETPTDDFNEQFQRLLEDKKDYIIFNDKKVK